MRFVSAFTLCSVLAQAISEEKLSFGSWMSQFSKSYATNEEYTNRHQIWLDNLAHVEAINAAKLSWRATIHTKFADMTSDEFQKQILMSPLHQPKPKDNTKTSTIHSRVAVHSFKRKTESNKQGETGSFDWRDYGAVTSVKDQGTVGTCWAFSTIGSVEGQWFLSQNELVDLSPEFLVDCDGTTDDEEGHADCGVFGGWPYLAYQFLLDSGGVPTEAAYPYCSGTGDCYPCMQGPVSLCGPPPYYCDRNISAACPQAPLYAAIQDWAEISSNEADIAAALTSVGPLSALLDATQLQFYDSGVWTGKVSSSPDALGCHASSLDHAVLLVGYGTTSASGNVNGNSNSTSTTTGTSNTTATGTTSRMDAGMDYWIVKNSWGQDFGEEGYFRIQRGTGTCGINTAVTTALG